jgi:hypothetical protein
LLSTGDGGSLDRDSTITRVRPKIIDVLDRDYVSDIASSGCLVGERNDLANSHNVRGLNILLSPVDATSEYVMLLRKERRGFEYPSNYVTIATTFARIRYYTRGYASGGSTFKIGVRVTYSDATVFDYTATVTADSTYGSPTTVNIDMSAQAGRPLSM